MAILNVYEAEKKFLSNFNRLLKRKKILPSTAGVSNNIVLKRGKER